MYYTASGIITPIGGCPVHSLREDSFKLCTVQPPIGVMTPEAVQYNFDFLTMSTWCLKHVEARNKLIVGLKQILCIKLLNY